MCRYIRHYVWAFAEYLIITMNTKFLSHLWRCITSAMNGNGDLTAMILSSNARIAA